MAHLIIAVHPGWHLNPLQPIDEANAVELIGEENDLLGSIPGLPLAPIAAGARGWQGLSSAHKPPEPHPARPNFEEET